MGKGRGEVSGLHPGFFFFVVHWWEGVARRGAGGGWPPFWLLLLHSFRPDEGDTTRLPGWIFSRVLPCDVVGGGGRRVCTQRAPASPTPRRYTGLLTTRPLIPAASLPWPLPSGVSTAAAAVGAAAAAAVVAATAAAVVAAAAAAAAIQDSRRPRPGGWGGRGRRGCPRARGAGGGCAVRVSPACGWRRGRGKGKEGHTKGAEAFLRGGGGPP